MSFTIHHGDCLEVMSSLPDNSVDAVVTDPPYGLAFMGKHWDHGVPGEDFWREALRVAKPGAHLLAFGGTRTFHRLMVAIEDAGWEIRDTLGFLYGPLLWGYGSGFPKSANGPWGSSALKPAYEPIIMARKPIERTLANNFEVWGTGGIHVEGCRVKTDDQTSRQFEASEYKGPSGYATTRTKKTVTGGHPAGRWPANIIHDGSEEVLGVFPDSANGRFPATLSGRSAFGLNGHEQEEQNMGDSGSAARFFYCAKASREDREEGLFLDARYEHSGPRGHSLNGDGTPRNDSLPRGNHHPTVKPTTLMRYLCRLVTPRNGTVLDPFCGSGSTGKGAILEGFNFIGIERESEYVEIARARCEWAAKQPRELDMFNDNPEQEEAAS